MLLKLKKEVGKGVKIIGKMIESFKLLGEEKGKLIDCILMLRKENLKIDKKLLGRNDII